ncbi:MAG TPA: integrase family protein, partial [Allosphingosinicella sp.]|nr:integrase family protein [Allosphingosinicella sp.]
MPKIKLDSTVCATAVCEPGKRKCDYWDTITSGFVLEVRSTGGKTYYLRYFDQNQRQRQLKIGGYADISFDQARKKAKKLRSEVVLGGDPLGEKDERRAIPTYASLAEQHLAYAKAHLRSHVSTETNLRVHILPRWAKLRLNEIKPQDISAWLVNKATEGLKPATVEKIRVLFGRSFELGRRWGLPGCENNPVRAVPRAKFNNARERFLTASEAARLLKACDESLNPQLG